MRFQNLRVGVVGCGYWGKHLLRNFFELGALAAIVDTDQKQTSQYTDMYGVPARTWDKLLSDNSIDAISIATPAKTHGALAIQALKHGKHVLVEKPMSLDISEAETIISLSRTYKLTAMVGHLLQYHPAFLVLRDLVTSGQLGGLRYLYSNRLNFGRFRTEENILWSFAPHDISMILALTNSAPCHVRAVGQSYLGTGVADSTITHITFDSGVQAHIYVSWLHPFKEQKLVVIGENAMAVFDDTQDWNKKLILYRHVIGQNSGIPVAERANAKFIPVEPIEPLKEECSHFLTCIEKGKSPRTDAWEGLKVLRVLTTAQKDLDQSLGKSA